MKTVEVETPHGPARAFVHDAAEPKAALVLMHGAGVGVDSPDIQAATRVALEAGVSVGLVEQPYMVAGRRSPAPAKQLDTAWATTVECLKANELAGLPLIVGGRSLGARVACRSAEAMGAIAVLCLAFPFQPAARKGGEPPPSRAVELDAVEVPVLVVQGERDQFGMPPEAPNRRVAKVPGNHGLKADLDAVVGAVRDWLPGVIG